MGDARRDCHRPSTCAASDIGANSSIGWQEVRWKDAKVPFENCLALFAREVLLVLAEGRPFLAKTSGDPRIDIFIGSKLHICLESTANAPKCTSKFQHVYLPAWQSRLTDQTVTGCPASAIDDSAAAIERTMETPVSRWVESAIPNRTVCRNEFSSHVRGNSSA